MRVNKLPKLQMLSFVHVLVPPRPKVTWDTWYRRSNAHEGVQKQPHLYNSAFKMYVFFLKSFIIQQTVCKVHDGFDNSDRKETYTGWRVDGHMDGVMIRHRLRGPWAIDCLKWLKWQLWRDTRWIRHKTTTKTHEREHTEQLQEIQNSCDFSVGLFLCRRGGGPLARLCPGAHCLITGLWMDGGVLVFDTAQGDNDFHMIQLLKKHFNTSWSFSPWVSLWETKVWPQLRA